MKFKDAFIDKRYSSVGKRSRHRGLIVGAFFLCFMIGLTACFPEQEQVLAPPLLQPMSREYQMHQVKKGDIVNRIEVTGKIISAMDYSLSFDVGGRLNSIHVKNGDNVEKDQVLVQLDTGDLIMQVELAKINAEKAQLVLKEAKDILRDVRKAHNNLSNPHVRSAQYAVQRAELDIKASEIYLNQFIARLQSASLVSPVQGVVVYVNINLKKGDYIHPFETVVQIADPMNLQIVFNPDRLRNPQVVKVGMLAELQIGNLKTTGKVVSSPFSAPMDVDENSRNIVVIDANEIPKDAEMGGMVNILIVLEKKENVLIIPLDILRTHMGRDFVHVLDEGMRREVNVEVGIRTATHAEILSGLIEGQEVILR